MAISPSSDGQIREGAEDKSLLQKQMAIFGSAKGYLSITARARIGQGVASGQNIMFILTYTNICQQ
jgi:hypothetical protein